MIGPNHRRPRRKRLLDRFAQAGVIQRLGPGLITGAADDDPSGIAAYAQAGAQFGVNVLRTVVLTYPLMAAIQSVSARALPAKGSPPIWRVFDLVGLGYAPIDPIKALFWSAVLTRWGRSSLHQANDGSAGRRPRSWLLLRAL
jgi:hypothetical protein